MSANGLMCGVAAHSPDCLCDVVVTDPVAVNPDLRHGWFVQEVMDFGKHDTSTPEGLLSFLESWTSIHDQFAIRQRLIDASGAGPRRHDDWRYYAFGRIDDGAPPRIIRQELKEHYAIDVSHSMFNQLKRRYLAKVAA